MLIESPKYTIQIRYRAKIHSNILKYNVCIFCYWYNSPSSCFYTLIMQSGLNSCLHLSISCRGQRRRCQQNPFKFISKKKSSVLDISFSRHSLSFLFNASFFSGPLSFISFITASRSASSLAGAPDPAFLSRLRVRIDLLQYRISLLPSSTGFVERVSFDFKIKT